jgi:glutathione S-transferase
MKLTLYYHPLASFCHKALIALYENATPFEPIIVDLGDEKSAADFKAVWPMSKFPVLRDTSRNQTVAESSVVIEYLDAFYPGKGCADASARAYSWMSTATTSRRRASRVATTPEPEKRSQTAPLGATSSIVCSITSRSRDFAPR